MATNVFPVDAVAGVPEYTGRETRQVLSALVGGATAARPLGGRSGVCAGPASVVSASGGNWTVGLHNGILDLETAVESGVYFYANDAVTTPSAITAAHATYARKDIVTVKLDDPAESDGSSVPAVTFVYTAGTASASPAAPSTPARSMVLAEINVPNVAGGGASSATVTQVWPYAVAVGGIIPVRSQAERDSITIGTAANPIYVDRLDTGILERSVASGTWLPYATKTPVSVVSTSGKTSAIPAGVVPIIRFERIAPTVTNGSGVINATFPTPFPNGVFGVFPITGSGSATAPVINGDTISTTGFSVAWPASPSTVVTTYYMAVGW